MHKHHLLWLFVGAFLAFAPARAQTLPAPAAGTGDIVGGAEQVLIAKVTGNVSMTVAGQTTPVNANDHVPQAATIITGVDSSVVIVFSNGATTQLGEDTELVIEEFLQDPFASTVAVAAMTEEPSRSKTRLALKRGELVGNVKKLQHAKGSSFIVTTPVGAAGIRGTTFRIVFRPAGGGQAFGGPATQNFQFSLSTLEGNVGFQSATPGGTPAGGTTAGTAAVTGVSVPTGQEIVVTVSVTQNPQGQLVVSAPPQVTGTVNINPATAAVVAQAAQQIIAATANASFAQPGAANSVNNNNNVPPTNTTAPAATPPAPRSTPLDGR